jgi:hypothetical protein
MKERLFEIRTKIDELRHQLDILHAEEQLIVQALIPRDAYCEDALEFIDIGRVIRWKCGDFRVGPKMYLLIKTIWESKKHRATIEKIERSVWRINLKNKFFVDRHTIFTLVCRAQKELQKNNFPYEIKAGKNFSTKEIKGFQLIYAPRIKNN